MEIALAEVVETIGSLQRSPVAVLSFTQKKLLWTRPPSDWLKRRASFHPRIQRSYDSYITLRQRYSPPTREGNYFHKCFSELTEIAPQASSYSGGITPGGRRLWGISGCVKQWWGNRAHSWSSGHQVSEDRSSCLGHVGCHKGGERVPFWDHLSQNFCVLLTKYMLDIESLKAR